MAADIVLQSPAHPLGKTMYTNRGPARKSDSKTRTGTGYFGGPKKEPAHFRAGFSYRKTMKHLADTGGIASGPDGKNSVQHWFNGRSSRFIGFRMSETPQQDFIETTDDEPVPFG